MEEPVGIAMPSGYIPTLDGWRAVAILSVLFCHAGQDVFGPTGAHPSARLSALSIVGAYGVDVFFGISGLLIGTRLLRERRIEGKVSLSGFYVRRTTRILPACYAYLAVLWLLTQVTAIRVDAGQWSSALLFYRNYRPDSAGWYTGHLWSLAVEEHFYLLLPAAIAFLRPARLVALLCGVSLAVAVWRYVGGTFLHLPVGARTDFRLDALLLGVLAAVLCESPRTQPLLAFARHPATLPVAVGALLVSFWRGGAIASVTIAVFVPVVLFTTAMQSRTWIARGLELAPVRWVGRLSYSLYLWQQLFLTGGRIPSPRPLGVAQVFPFNLLALLACAAGSFYLVEKPMIRWGRALATARAHRSTQAPRSRPG